MLIMLSLSFFLALIPIASGAVNGQIVATGPLKTSTFEATKPKFAHVFQKKTTATESQQVETYIAAGTKAELNEFPWIVKSASLFSICTAVLIHEAAHCQGVFFDGLIISAYNFTNSIEGSIYREIEMQVRHKGYNQNMSVIVDDLMVIKLSEPVTEVTPVALNRDPDSPTFYEKMYAAGFGIVSYLRQSPPDLQKVDLHYIPPDLCESYYKRFDNVDAGPGLLCAASRDRAKSVCHGDSGGPLVTEDKRTLMGITSFGALCETKLAPNGFSRISYYYDWIHDKICKLSVNPPSNCPPNEPETNQEAVAVNITIQHDFFSWETTWSVRDRSDNSIQVVGPVGNPSSNSLWFTTIHLLPGEYTFELYDMTGNGMTGVSGDPTSISGWFEISAFDTSATEILIPQTYANFTSVMSSDFVVPHKKTKGQHLSPMSFPTAMPSIFPLPSASSSLQSNKDWAAVQAITSVMETSGSDPQSFFSTFLFWAFLLIV